MTAAILRYFPIFHLGVRAHKKHRTHLCIRRPAVSKSLSSVYGLTVMWGTDPSPAVVRKAQCTAPSACPQALPPAPQRAVGLPPPHKPPVP